MVAFAALQLEHIEYMPAPHHVGPTVQWSEGTGNVEMEGITTMWSSFSFVLGALACCGSGRRAVLGSSMLQSPPTVAQVFG